MEKIKGVFYIWIISSAHSMAAIETTKDGMGLNQFVIEVIDENLEWKTVTSL